MESSILSYLVTLLEQDGNGVELVEENSLHVIIDDWKAQITVDWADIVD